MKYYKKPDNSVWAFEADGSQDHLITDEMRKMTAAEVQEHINRVPATPKPIDLIRAIEASQKVQDAMNRASRQTLLEQMAARSLKESSDYQTLLEAEAAIDLLRKERPR